MGNYEDLKEAIKQVVKENGAEAITGDILQNILVSIVSNLGFGATFAGIATPETNPGNPDNNLFYIAGKPGLYANFGGVQLTDEVLVFQNKSGSWQKISTGIATTAKLTELGNKASSVGYVTCDTVAAASEKTLVIQGITVLTTGVRLLIKMTNHNTAGNATLNINSLGAKPLFYDGARVNSDNAWKDGEVIDVYYDGTNFLSTSYQGGTGSGGNMILEWKTDVAATRKQVAENDRKAGMQISYLDPDNGWINEQYIGTEVPDTEWGVDNNWEQIGKQKDIDNLSADVSPITDVFEPAHNIYNGSLSDSGYYDQYNNGKYTTSTSFVCDKNPIEVKGGAKLYYYLEDISVPVSILEYDEEDNFLKRSSIKLQKSYLTLNELTVRCRLYAQKTYTSRIALGYSEFTEYIPYELTLSGRKIKDGSVTGEKIEPSVLLPLDKIPVIEKRIETVENYFVTISNIVLNGNMSDGTNNWKKYTSTSDLSVEDGALKMHESSVDSKNSYVRQDMTAETVSVGKKYFVAFDSNVSRDVTAMSMRLFSTGNASAPFATLVSSGKTTGWVNNYGIVEVPESAKEGTLYIQLRADYTVGSEFTMMLRNVMIVALSDFKQIGLNDADSIYNYVKKYLGGYIGQNQNVSDLKYIMSKLTEIDARLFGQTTVVLGDSVMDYCNIPETLAKISGMNVINCAVGGTRMGKHVYDNYGAWSFYKLADAIVSGDYTEQEEATSIGKNIVQRIANLTSIDWNTVNNLIVAFGTNDWISSNTIEKEGEDFTSIYYALTYGLSKIMTKYPHIKIIVVTPSFRIIDGNNSDTYQYSQNNLTLPQVVECIQEGSKISHVLCCDNYWELQVNKDNYKYYLDGTETEDGQGGYVHPNVTVGASLFANRIFSFMKSNL